MFFFVFWFIHVAKRLINVCELRRCGAVSNELTAFTHAIRKDKRANMCTKSTTAKGKLQLTDATNLLYFMVDGVEYSIELEWGR